MTIGNGGGSAPVPTTDSVNNSTMADVIGNKTDGHNGDSLYSLVGTLLEHAHSASQVYPSQADGVVLTAANGATTWTLGAIVQVVPDGGITSDFDIHFVGVEDLSANSVYEIVLYAGVANTEIGRVRVTKNAVQDGTTNAPMQTPDILPANTRISAAVATANDNGETATISIFWHAY